jgi:hypothetical protein
MFDLKINIFVVEGLYSFHRVKRKITRRRSTKRFGLLKYLQEYTVQELLYGWFKRPKYIEFINQASVFRNIP